MNRLLSASPLLKPKRMFTNKRSFILPHYSPPFPFDDPYVWVLGGLGVILLHFGYRKISNYNNKNLEIANKEITI